jgi:hypothetical protein
MGKSSEVHETSNAAQHAEDTASEKDAAETAMEMASAEESPDTADRNPRLSHGTKVKRGQLTSVQQGRYGTGPAPYGYRRGNDNEKPLVVDDREAEVVRIIFREYLNTRSTGKVVSYLHSRGIFTRKGNKWSRQAIAIILSNRTYRGRVSYGDVETEGLHAPIIEPALFYKANALKERKRRRRKQSGSKRG